MTYRLVAVVVVLAGCGHGGRGATGRGSGSDAGGVAQVDSKAPDAVVHPEKVMQLNEEGVLVDIEASFVPGYVTIVDFWASWCGGCKVVADMFMAVVGDEPRILIRKVDVGDGDTPVAHHYDVGPLPHLRIYNSTGELRYILHNNPMVENNVNQAGEKALEVLAEDLKKE